MTTSPVAVAGIITTLMLVSSGTHLVASQATSNATTLTPRATNSLFYERQVALTTISGQPSASGTQTSSTTASILQTDEEHKKIIAFREQKEEAERKEEVDQHALQAYAKTWLQEKPGAEQQLLAEQLAEVTPLPKDLAKLITLYEYAPKTKHAVRLGKTSFCCLVLSCSFYQSTHFHRSNNRDLELVIAQEFLRPI